MDGQFFGQDSEARNNNGSQDSVFMYELLNSYRQGRENAHAAELSAMALQGQNFAVPPLGNMSCNDVDVEVQEVSAAEAAAAAEKKKGASHRGLQFKEEEDIIIVSGWLNIATDAVTGTNQSKFSFFKRLYMYYMECMKYESSRTQKSIQQRWQTIKAAVSEFHAIFAALERRRESGKAEKDLIADAVKMYEQTRPWQFRHCWDILRYEPRWNTLFQEIQAGKKGKQADPQPSNQQQAASETQTPTEPTSRPEGRDSVKRKRARQLADDASSSPAVEMLQKMHARDQEMDERDNKHKEELMMIERTKVELQQKSIDVQLQISEKKMELKEKELETQIMFTDPRTTHPSLRAWILKKQREILLKEGIAPPEDDNSEDTSAGGAATM